jgi:hypothetical protein
VSFSHLSLLLVALALFSIAYSRIAHTTALTDWGLTAGIFFGLLAIALAIGFGLAKRINDFLNETRRGLVDEKIAMLYGYAEDVKKWNNSSTDSEYKVQRIMSDLRSLGRMKKVIQKGQKEDLTTAKDRVLGEMRKKSELIQQANEIDNVFNAWLL